MLNGLCQENSTVLETNLFRFWPSSFLKKRQKSLGYCWLSNWFTKLSTVQGPEETKMAVAISPSWWFDPPPFKTNDFRFLSCRNFCDDLLHFANLLFIHQVDGKLDTTPRKKYASEDTDERAEPGSNLQNTGTKKQMESVLTSGNTGENVFRSILSKIRFENIFFFIFVSKFLFSIEPSDD